MINRKDLLDRKKTEIESIIREICIEQHDNDQQSSDFLQFFLKNECLFLTYPEEMPHTTQLIIINSSSKFQNGESIKPGNIMLNIKKLIDSLPDLTIACVAVSTEIPILKVCAFLNIWKMLRNIISIKITKDEAMTIIALWESCNKDRKITTSNGFDSVNAFLKNLSMNKYTMDKYIDILNKLKEIGSIELSKDDKDTLWLREWVSKKYC